MALGTNTSPALTQEQVQRILVEPLEKASVFLAAGPQVFNTNGSPVRIPKLPPPTSPQWHAQNEQISEVSPDFDEIMLLPDNMKSVKTITRFSNELARQSVVALDQALQTRLVRDVAGAVDQELINGTATVDANNNVTPLGILNYPDSQEMAAVGAVTLDDLHDAVGLALGAEVNVTGLKWMMTSRDFVNLRKIKDTQERYQLQPDPTQAGQYVLLGYPVVVTNRIPADGGVGANESDIVLADFSQVAVARDMAPSVTILSERYADYDQQALRVVSRYDAAPMNAEAVVVLRGVTG